MYLGTWVHTPATVDAVDGLVEQLAARGVDTVCAYAKTWTAETNYPSDVAHVREGYEDGRAFARLVDACHERGIACEAWVCCFTEGPRSRLFERHPECRAADGRASAVPNEEGAIWPCPARPETRDYLLAICREVLDRYPALDALHLDYIRYPWANAAVCTCGYCQREFRRRFGLDLLADVICNTDERPGFAAFVDWRCGFIRDVVARARSLTRDRGKRLTAAVFPFYPSIVFDLGQDWVAWCRDGLLDGVYPMNYNRHPYLVGQYTAVHTALLAGNDVRLREGLWTRDGMDAEAARDLSRAALRPGVEGLMIFHAEALAALPEDTFRL